MKVGAPASTLDHKIALRWKLHAKDSKAENLGFWWLCWTTKAQVSLPSGFFLYQRENSICLVWVSITNSSSQFLTLYPKLIFYFFLTNLLLFKSFLCPWNIYFAFRGICQAHPCIWAFELAVHSWLGLSSPKIPFGSLFLISFQMPTYQQNLPEHFFLKLHSFLHYTFHYPEFIFLSTYKYLIYNYLFICWFFCLPSD